MYILYFAIMKTHTRAFRFPKANKLDEIVTTPSVVFGRVYVQEKY